MAWFTLIVFSGYLILIITIIPKTAFEFDLFKIRFNLLPYWTKAVSLVIIVLAVVIFIYNRTMDKAEEYLLVSINLALFLLLFSKQRLEDEYTEQVRFKSFTYSFVSFVGLLGAFSALTLVSSDDHFIMDNFILNLLIGTATMMALIYFNITLYKSRKN